MFNLKKILLSVFLVVSVPFTTLNASENHNLTDTQLHAVMGIITSFILMPIGSGGSGSSIVHNGTTYSTVTSPYTGKVWLDRNLGASQVCTSFDDTACYGDYYQWGRNADGHEDSISSTATTQATDVNSAGSSFINCCSDWAASVDSAGTTRTANWSVIDGSSVCPVGFRVPTIAEIKAELLDTGSAQVQNSVDAFNSFLKLPSAGNRNHHTASLNYKDSWGYMWSSSVNGTFSYLIYFGSSGTYTDDSLRSAGFSVRCLRD